MRQGESSVMSVTGLISCDRVTPPPTDWEQMLNLFEPGSAGDPQVSNIVSLSSGLLLQRFG